MKTQIRIAPSNSVVLVMDTSIGEIPDPDPEDVGEGVLAATSSCIAVGTLPQIEGDTHILLYDEPAEMDLTGTLAFDGPLEVRSGRMSVVSVLHEPLLGCNAPTPRARVQVWLNDDRLPDEIRIYVSDFVED